ncbi:hypothetical protein BDF20DRAFT_864910 [Mycotypha africana]|uniref:uncharacterized protein n=1 Tax=Mycotypha africana TaxID=64632 RepID=UPI002301E529|nr:uncharacterized protein BDF20DRAFT_864910 [Mycotypha africana]KAI8982088.1 hypothetical protein BDF20DRAFT_864910 [Mycotypha africana]
MYPFRQQGYNSHPSPFLSQNSSPITPTAQPGSFHSPYGNHSIHPLQQQQVYQRQSYISPEHHYPSLAPASPSIAQSSSLQRSSTYLLPQMLDSRTQYLWEIFQKVDADRSGTITVHELQSALVNGDWSPFNIETVRLMVSIFDTDNNGTIDFREFQGLWKYIEDWSRCFKQFDNDHSGSIDCMEMAHALRAFGFNVSDRFVSILVQSFDKYGRGDVTFDNFVQACVTLETLTKLFRARDYENRGSVLINYEDFLTMIIGSRPNMKGN